MHRMRMLVMMHKEKLRKFFEGLSTVDAHQILNIGEKHHVLTLVIIDHTDFGCANGDDLKILHWRGDR